MADAFRGYLVSKDAAGKTSGRVETLALDQLPEGDALIRVDWSSLNYKDALSASGNMGVTKNFPHIPGIDSAGTVAESTSPTWKPGTKIVITGFDQGAGRWGGYAELVRAPAAWLVRLPDGLTTREAMIYGTAGFTAAQCIAALIEHGVQPNSGPIVVTGASGGVGSLAVAILSKLGYHVAAVSGKPEAKSLLEKLGAKEILSRSDVDDRGNRPLLSARWAGAVDTVGGNTLATILRSTQPLGCVTACGLVGGTDLPTTVFPFILRGVTLVGIDSVHCPYDRRLDLWSRLAGPWKPSQLEDLVHEIGWSQLDEQITGMLAGKAFGRVIVRAGE